MTLFSVADCDGDETETDCGTCGCAVGHGPYAGIPKVTGEDWPTYCTRCFSPWMAPATSYMFAPRWADVDNSPLSAARRVDEVVACDGWLPPGRNAVHCAYCNKFFAGATCEACGKYLLTKLHTFGGAKAKLSKEAAAEALAAIVAFRAAATDFSMYHCRRYYNAMVIAGTALIAAQRHLGFWFIHPDNISPGLKHDDPRIVEE